MSLLKTFANGLFHENPTFRLVLGMCPTLAVTTSLENGLGMGLAVTFVLVCSNVIVSAIRKVIPEKVHIPCYIVVIAAFVTILELVMKAYFLSLSQRLGIFLPLIVVNCIILGRAEAFAAKNPVLASAFDGLGMGLGFTMSLSLVSTIRELIGSGTLLGHPVFGASYTPTLLAVLPPGGFLVLGLLLALMNHLGAVRARSRGLTPPEPLALDCRTCVLCPRAKPGERP